jgi:pyruvate dehydrogenase E2 component (dihydrolipoamide acetyltransferase)
MGEFRMPSLGADMEYGTVVEWLVSEGDEVSRGDIVAVVDTDKADIDVEIFESGVIEEILVPAGERVEVGVPLARLHPVAKTQPVDGTPAQAAPAAAPPQAPTPAAGELSPVLRRLAKHLDVDISNVTGSGPDGAITRDDIEAAAASTDTGPAAPPEPEAVADRTTAMRSAIADLMARSKREIPHYYVGTDIDMSTALAHLESRNSSRSVADRVLPAALLLKAAAVAARRVPELNGTWVDGRFHPADHVHLGVAVRLRGGGLVAPALHDADELPVDELMRRLQDLVQRARSGRLRSSEMSDPTLTVTQLGDQGVDTVIGVIYPPQVALLGLGSITDRPWAADGMIGARPVLRATLAADHRATDGMTGARYLSIFDQLLHEPETL